MTTRLTTGDAAECRSTPDDSVEPVFLLHGLGRTSRCMMRLARALTDAGFTPLPWDYPSIRGRIGQHAERLRAEVARVGADERVRAIHFVTHSLGGIIVRAALCGETLPCRTGRVVMLAPPNHGSRVARWLAPLAGWCVPTLRDLSDAPQSLVRQLPCLSGLELGVVAGRRDGKVRVADTHLTGEADHLVVPGAHTFIMSRADVIAHVVAFLRHGRFLRTGSES